MPRFNPKVFALTVVPFLGGVVFAEQRFPPPEFESGYQLPVTATPPGGAAWTQYLDTGVLAGCLAVALWLIYKRRSRRGLFWLSLFSLAYFGFYRKGCVCPIGSPQNITYALCNSGYAVPLTVLAFFVLPLAVALFAGRAFCAGVCPHGAIQDFFLIKPVKVPLWVEEGLGIIPFLILGAGLACAATGAGFLICRYDPLVPLFRFSGSSWMLLAGAAILALGTFIGRPYCRFLCPYGALLRLASQASKWRVRVTPDFCTQCQLCENACPYGVIRRPSPGTSALESVGEGRRRLGWSLLALPILVAAGAWGGSRLTLAAARIHPTVALSEFYVSQKENIPAYGVMTPERLSLERVEQDPKAIASATADLRRRFHLAASFFGAWTGLVLGTKLIGLSVRRSRTDYEPDQGGCFACARCFRHCPNERTRLGLKPAST